jgi:hypothetical protein
MYYLRSWGMIFLGLFICFAYYKANSKYPMNLFFAGIIFRDGIQELLDKLRKEV